MTSSFILEKLAEQPNLWTYSLPGSPLGGQEDSYIKIQGECHPDFVAVPIGKPWGTKMCVRKTDKCGRRIGDTLQLQAQEEIKQSQGYWRGSVNLYDVKQMTPTQISNPQYYSDRRTPYEADLIRADLLRAPISYSGTGIKTLRTPHELLDKNKPYYEYDMATTFIEDPKTGNRTATKLDQAIPPAKYDINRLHQIYPRWKEEGAYLGHNRDKYDRTNMLRIV